jgi:uncharacterized BrkB/YihY/UPF0761 family membrane protein
VALITGVIGVLLAAIGLTSQLQNSFDTIVHAVPDPRSGLKRTIYIKIKNLIIIGLAAVVGIGSVVLSATISAANLGFGAEVLDTGASLVISILVLYLMYRLLPDVVIPRKIVLVAASVIGLLFLVGKIILGIVIVKVYGENHNIEYKAKAYTLKRHSLNINVKQDLRGRTMEAFVRGYRSKKH